MKAQRSMVVAVALLALAGLGGAAMLGLLGDLGGLGSRGEKTAPSAEAEAAADRVETVAAAGRARVAPEEPGELGRGAPPEGRPSFAGGEPPSAPAPGVAEVLNAPPAASAAALDFDRAAGAASSLDGVASALSPAAPRPGGDIAPEFDVVRVARDGSAVLAGRAAPGAQVQVLVDGLPSETVQADSAGEFVALISPPSEKARRRSSRRIDLSARNPDGRVLDSSAPVVIANDPSVPEQPPVAMRPGRESIEILQPAARDAARVTIDAVTYGDRGALMISGRGKPGELARVYLDNSLKAESRIATDGVWRVRISSEIKPALYRLRVDQTSSSGAVTSRAETPFERAEPSNVKVADGTVIVQPGNNLWRIAAYVYGDGARYTVIYGTNKQQIRDPDLIYPGQVLTLPKDG